MPASKAADIILDGLAAKKREIVVADDRMHAAIQLRGQDPEMVFGLMAEEGARLATLREQAGPGFSAQNATIIVAT